jgi:hypothetical protein
MGQTTYIERVCDISDQAIIILKIVGFQILNMLRCNRKENNWTQRSKVRANYALYPENDNNLIVHSGSLIDMAGFNR